MAALVIPNNTPFGGMTNQMVSRLVNLNVTVPRLQEAIATASSGYTGTPGTEFEAPVMGTNMNQLPNNFMIQPEPNIPGKCGNDYSYAINQLANIWATFWIDAQPYIEQLDNGGNTF
jgi:hypothetical protein